MACHTEFAYLPTRPPVILDWWGPAADAGEAPDGRYTTVTSRDQSENDIVWDGRVHSWSKNSQFRKFIDLPSLVPATFELAVARMAEADRSGFARRDR